MPPRKWAAQLKHPVQGAPVHGAHQCKVHSIHASTCVNGAVPEQPTGALLVMFSQCSSSSGQGKGGTGQGKADWKASQPGEGSGYWMWPHPNLRLRVAQACSDLHLLNNEHRSKQAHPSALALWRLQHSPNLHWIHRRPADLYCSRTG